MPRSIGTRPKKDNVIKHIFCLDSDLLVHFFTSLGACLVRTDRIRWAQSVVPCCKCKGSTPQVLERGRPQTPWTATICELLDHSSAFNKAFLSCGKTTWGNHYRGFIISFLSIYHQFVSCSVLAPPFLSKLRINTVKR